jgi:CRISPR/Cas system-associated exonuclease Cas4 (RecB family)
MFDLFTKVDEKKDLQLLAEELGWVITSPNEAFQQQLATTMKLENPNRPSKPGFIRPSSLQDCVRKLVFEYVGAEEEFGYDGTPRIGESGTDAHKHIQEYIAAMGTHEFPAEFIDIKEFLRMYPNPDLEIIDETKDHLILDTDVVNDTITYTDGEKKKTKKLSWYLDRYCGPETLVYNKKTHSRFKADGIVKYKGKFYVLEIKTETSAKYKKHDKTLEPHYKHTLQGAFYAMSFGIEDVMFLYENRDNCQFFITIMNVSRELAKKVDLLITETLRYGEKGWIAPRTIEKDECKYCPYQTRCNGIGESLPR